MGYRSEVVLVLSKEAKETLKEKLDALPKEEKENIKSMFSCADRRFIHESGDELIHWTWVKWYNSYPEIAFIEDFLNNREDEDYYLMRIGEDLGDIELQGYFYDNPFDANIETRINYYTPNCVRVTNE